MFGYKLIKVKDVDHINSLISETIKTVWNSVQITEKIDIPYNVGFDLWKNGINATAQLAEIGARLPKLQTKEEEA